MRLVRFLALLTIGLAATLGRADEPKAVPAAPKAVTKPLPQSLEELRTFERQTRAVIDRVMGATVCLQVGGATGSGVIVSKDGLILTAGHVSAEPDRKIRVIFPDGKEFEATTLGLSPGKDTGMAKLPGDREWPSVEMGHSKDLSRGQWVVSLGHPGGIRKDRPPVVRVGKINFTGDNFLVTDCTLVGGDSGGPLFDMEGKLIGIHSRIGMPITANMHVPIAVYKEQWDKLLAAEWVDGNPVYLGVTADSEAKSACKLKDVTDGSPAAKAGLKAGDVIAKFDGKEVKSYDDMVKLLHRKKPGMEVTLEVRRSDEIVPLKVKLGRRRG